MATIYVGQTALQVIFRIKDQDDVAVDISTATVAIKYKRPNQTTGTWEAIKSGTPTNQVYWEPSSASDLNMPGTWILWADVTLTGGKRLASEPVKMTVKKEGE